MRLKDNRVRLNNLFRRMQQVVNGLLKVIFSLECKKQVRLSFIS